jgi:hypothetical protein
MIKRVLFSDPLGWVLFWMVLMGTARAEDLLSGGSMQSFRSVKHWRTVAEVAAAPDETALSAKGQGSMLLNGGEKNTGIPFLLTKGEYGDVKVELEFMIPLGSNAGVYLMGRYEVQILDSFGKKEVNAGDLGGIYQRYDASRPKGQQGFEGTAPRVNAAKAPGEWQTMEIIFRAPRFDEAGQKQKDALFEKVMVNGAVVQENATTSGPTRSAAYEGDAPRGPIAIQGDHGPIAIRKFHVTSLDPVDQRRVAEIDAYWKTVSRAVNEGDFEAYRATCHSEGVLVSGNKRMTQPLSAALARWKQEFVDTKEGKMKASVAFRFSRRLGDATTAHETGIFRYESQRTGAAAVVEYVRFEALLVKRQDAWQIVMENQQESASEDAWKALE